MHWSVSTTRIVCYTKFSDRCNPDASRSQRAYGYAIPVQHRCPRPLIESDQAHTIRFSVAQYCRCIQPPGTENSTPGPPETPICSGACGPNRSKTRIPSTSRPLNVRHAVDDREMRCWSVGKLCRQNRCRQGCGRVRRRAIRCADRRSADCPPNQISRRDRAIHRSFATGYGRQNQEQNSSWAVQGTFTCV